MISVVVSVATVAIALADGGSEPVAYSVAALVSWGFVLAGIAAGFFPRERPPGLALAAGVALAALATVAGISATWASDAGAAFDEAVVALAYAGLFALVVVASARGEARTWLAGLAIGLVAVAVLALGARLEPSLFGDGERELIERLPAAEGRLADPFLYWNALAAALATCLVLAVWLAANAATRARRALTVAAIPAVLLALYMTTSRGGAAAALIGLVALIAVGPLRIRLAGALAIGGAAGAALIWFASERGELLDHPLSELARDQAGGVELALLAAVALAGALAYAADPVVRSWRAPQVTLTRGRIAGLAALCALAAAGFVIAADPDERWEEFKRPPDAPAAGAARDLLGRGDSSGRYQFWSAAVDAFEAEPLRGVGGGGYEYWWNQHGSLAQPGPNGHSLIFDTAAELGLLGLAALAGFGGVALWAGVTRLRGDPERGATGAAFAVLVAGLAGAAADWIWENPGAFGAIVVAAALLSGPATAREAAASVAPAPGIRRNRRRFAGGVLVLAFSWAAICAAALLLLTNLSLDSSRGAFGDDDLAAAEDAANDAIDLQPWAAQPRLQLGLVLEQGGDLAGAELAIDEAIEHSPEDWRLRLLAARLALAAGDRERARADAFAAQSLAPRLEPLAKPVDEILDGLL